MSRIDIYDLDRSYERVEDIDDWLAISHLAYPSLRALVVGVHAYLNDEITKEQLEVLFLQKFSLD